MNTGQKIEEWFVEYSDDIYNYLVYYTGSKDVEDMVQEVFIKAMRGVKNFKGFSTPKTWLFTIARNTALDYYRKKGHEKQLPYDNLADSAYDESVESKLQLKEEMHDLYCAVNNLKKTYRDVVILRGIKGLSPSETAEILKWSETKVNVTLYRALRSLRKQLATGQIGGYVDER